MTKAIGVNTRRFTTVSSTSAMARPTNTPKRAIRCSMRAAREGLTNPIPVSTTTATTTSSAASSSPIHQSKAAKATGRRSRGAS